MTIKIKVELTIKDKTVELTFDEAKALYFQLKPFIEKTNDRSFEDYYRSWKEQKWVKPSDGYHFHNDKVFCNIVKT